MPNIATQAEHGANDPLLDSRAQQPAPARDDLQRVAAALVQIDAWCRQRGLEELSRLLEPAVDWSDRALTDG